MPINKPPLEDKIGVPHVWERWFSSVGDSLIGEWELYTAPLTFTGSGTQSVNIQNMGKSALVQIKIESASVGVVTLPFRAKEAILSVWDLDTQTLIGGALVSGSLIQLPVISGNILIEGMVIKWTL